jgi:hypothetical protein
MFELSSRRIGVGVSRDSMRALALVRGKIVWACERTLGEGETLEEALSDLLKSAPIRRWLRPTVTIALGPATARVKRLSGLPPLERPELLHAVVSENAGRFFARQDGPASVRAVSAIDSTAAWAVLVDDATVHTIDRTFRSVGLRAHGFVPSVVAIAAAVTDQEATLADAGIRAVVRIVGDRPVDIRHAPDAAGRTYGGADRLSPVEPLALLGADAPAYAAAYGAAALGRGAMLAFQAERKPAEATSIARWRRVLAISAAVVGVALPLAVPIALPARSARRDRTVLLTLDRNAQTARAAYSDLARFTAALNAAGSFNNRRLGTSLLLADLTRQIPSGTAIVSLQVDTLGGSLVVLGDRATTVMTILEKIPRITSPRLAGPVTREVAGGREVDRVAIRFSIGDPSGLAGAKIVAADGSSGRTP